MKEVLIFTTPACGPCKAVKPILEELHAEYGFPLRVIQASIQSQEEFVKHGVRTAPTVICLNDGVEVGRFAGMRTADAVKGALQLWGVL